VARYAILEHDHPVRHWDLMLEVGEVLRTWRLQAPPEAGCAIPAEPLGDHRRMYLDYEGPVSGNRGTVRRWDAGDYELIVPAQASDALELVLSGSRFSGRATLRTGEQPAWFFSSQTTKVGAH
jgi:hypothetical protein